MLIIALALIVAAYMTGNLAFLAAAGFVGVISLVAR